MRGLKKKRRIQIITLALICLAGATALVGFALKDGINLFRSPTQIVENPPPVTEIFRAGGLVVVGSMQKGQGIAFSFSVTDGANVIDVKYVGDDIPPDLFEEGQGTVITGTYVDDVFLATEILAKHDETYMPKEVVDILKEQGVYKPADG